MRDLLGNTLAPRQLVLWRPPGMTAGMGVIATILHIDEPTLSSPGDERQPQIVLVVPLPITAEHGASLAHLKVEDILCLVNPQQQSKLESILAERGGKPQ